MCPLQVRLPSLRRVSWGGVGAGGRCVGCRLGLVCKRYLESLPRLGVCCRVRTSPARVGSTITLFSCWCKEGELNCMEMGKHDF